MNTVLALVLIVSFVVLLVYLLRGGNLMIGFFFISLLWCIVAGMGPTEIQQLFNDRIVGSASTVFCIIFGSWFGRVLVDTDIVSTLIKKTVELGGDRPKITMILLAIVSTAIFSGVYGIGITMAVGLITLPIMFSLGIPKPIAVTAFCMSHAAGMMVNPNPFSQIQVYYPDMVYQGTYFNFGVTALAITLIFTVAMILVRLRKGKIQHAWAVQASSVSGVRNMFFLAYLTPICPVVLVAFLGWEIIPALILSIVIAVVLTGEIRRPKKCVELLLRTLRDGMNDIAILIGIMTMIWVYASAAQACAPILDPFVTPILPDSALVIAIAVGVLAPLGLFRGPLTLSGIGSAVMAILAATAADKLYPYTFTAMLTWVPWITMTFGTCPTQSTNAWVLSYTKLEVKEHLKSTLPWTWAVAFVLSIVMYFFFGNVPF